VLIPTAMIEMISVINIGFYLPNLTIHIEDTHPIIAPRGIVELIIPTYLSSSSLSHPYLVAILSIEVLKTASSYP